MNQEAFAKAQEKIIGIDRQRLSIGTYGEKTVHAVVKNYYQPNEAHQEIPIETYVADIFKDGEVIEIQTRQFYRLKGKLACFLPRYKVKVVYPIPRQKQVIWIDLDSGALSKPRKAPKKGTPYDAFKELYQIREFLDHPNLTITLLLMDMEEYKLLNGWSKDKKRGSERFDRIPTALVEEIDLTCKQDYLQFVPYELPEQFLVKEYAKAAHISPRLAGYAIQVLAGLGVVEHVGNAGRAYLYQVKE